MTKARKIMLNTWRVREAAARQGHSLKEVADLMEISPQTSAYRFKTGWTIRDAMHLASVLQVSLHTLWTEPDSQFENENEIANGNENENENTIPHIGIPGR